jgi:hypothetical protein
MMKTMIRRPLLSNTTMTGTLARMLGRTADAIGHQTMGIIAGLIWESIVESITTGTQRLAMITVNLTMEHLGIFGRPTMEYLDTITVRLINFAGCLIASRDERDRSFRGLLHTRLHPSGLTGATT